MIRRLKALVWLRTQILISNKNVLVPVLMPYFMVLLFKFTMNTEGANGIVLMALCFSMAIGMAVGSPISTMISEEKEKKNLNSLMMSGIRPIEYVLSVIFYPICISLFNLILFPIIAETDITEFILVYVISMSLTSIMTILVNFYVGLISNSQSQAQIIAMVLNMYISMAPSLSMSNEGVAKFVDYSFLGLYTAFYNNPKMDLISSQFYILLAWIILITFAILLYLKMRGGNKMVNKSIKWERREVCLNK